MLDTAFDHGNRTTPQSGPRDWLRGLVAFMSRLKRNRRRRRHLAILSRFNDEELADMGLRRDDLYEAAMLGAEADVTRHLADTSRQRRRAIHPRGI